MLLRFDFACKIKSQILLIIRSKLYNRGKSCIKNDF